VSTRAPSAHFAIGDVAMSGTVLCRGIVQDRITFGIDRDLHGLDPDRRASRYAAIK